MPRRETVEDLWFGIAWAPSFGGVFLAATFAGRSHGPVWEMWGLRAVVVLFWCFVGSLSAAPCFRELRRRGKWVPAGAARRPWLAAAGYVAVVLLTATLLILGLVGCVHLVLRAIAMPVPN